MILLLDVTTAAGKVRQTVGPRAQIAWEIRTRSKISALASNMGMADLAALSYEQAKIDGNAPSTEAAYIETLLDLDPVPSDPT